MLYHLGTMQTQAYSRRSSRSFWFHALSAVAAVLALGLTAASAHPGHGLDTEPVSHYLTSPYHLMVLTAIGGGLLIGATFVKRLATRRAMQFTGITALVIAAVIAVPQFLG